MGLKDLRLGTRYGTDFLSYCYLVGCIDGKFQMGCQGSYVSDFKFVEPAFHSLNGHDRNLGQLDL